MARPIYRGWRGDRLKTRREAAGCTQDQLALAIGAQPTMVSKWERGVVIPTAENVARLAEALGVAPQDFTDVDLTSGSLVDLRLWAGRTRAQAAEAAGMSEHRLLSIERSLLTPRPAELEKLGELYAVDTETVQAAWARTRSTALGALARVAGRG